MPTNLTNRAVLGDSRVTAVLGPTNTGKTWRALERMLSYKTGVIGFPLRLLARENYDRVVKIRGAHAAALITGEEKILPPKARYFLCTTESMPLDREFEFLGIDEIQLCADPERGHIFTDRLLRARGTLETMFMGSDSMTEIIRQLVPDAEFTSRPRFSKLSYAGAKKLSRLPARSAVVAFSINDVYNVAELIRRQRGGTAVVLGALSPRTRNAQVDMYQSGEVDFLVATDAIGMGLNMDIHHVAFAATRKFDGLKSRALFNHELAQIAGRAGRHTRDGTFGVTGPVKDLDEDTVEAIENHRFAKLKNIQWRNAALDFSSAKALISSLERPSETPVLTKARPASDTIALTHLLAREDIRKYASTPEAVELLWAVCQIPDFRQTMNESHHALLAEIYLKLTRGKLRESYIAEHVNRLKSVEGDVDALMARIAHVRTWTYIAQHERWVENAEYWQEKTRDIEDKISDALHEALTRRFVDQRASTLMRSLGEQKHMLAGIKKDGEVVVEGHAIGQLRGFRFIPDETAKGPDFKTVMSAARSALKQEIQKRKNMMLTAEDKQFKLQDDGLVFYQADKTNPLPGVEAARVEKGASILRPVVTVTNSDLLDDRDKQDVAAKIQDWLHRHIDAVLEPLKKLEIPEEEQVSGAVRGICFQTHEALGIVPRHVLEPLIAELTPEDRAALRARKVMLGPVLVFIPALNKPAAVRLRGLLWSLWHEKPLPAPVPNDGVVSFAIDKENADPRFYRAIGYPVYGPRAVRIDMLGRVISAVYDSAKDGKFKAEHKMAEWLGSSIPDLYAVLEAMGHRKIYDPAEESSESQEASGELRVASCEREAESAEERAEDKSQNISAPLNQEQSQEGTEKTAPEAQKQEQSRPELATFLLKKGKASDKPKPPAHARKKHNKDDGKKPERDKREHRKAKPKKQERKETILSANVKSKPEDSPFAVLEQLKKQGNE